MKSKRWGFAAITAAIVATFCAVGPPAAHADPTGPTVTSVDRSGAQPVITIDWGANADAPVGVLESVDGYQLGTPSEMATVVDDYGTSPGLRSYRAAACYANCDLDSITAGSATLVQGDWLRPDVGDLASRRGPAAYANWNGRTGGFDIDVDTSPAPDAPAVGLYRNGEAIAVLEPPASGGNWYFDAGAFGTTVTYEATACYADCTTSSLASGFADQTTVGYSLSVHAQTSSLWVGMWTTCGPSQPGGHFDTPLQVGVVTTCTVHVYNGPYSLNVPTGTVKFSTTDDALVPPSSCDLVAISDWEASCELAIEAQPDSEGLRIATVEYPGDAHHWRVSITSPWDVNPPADTPPAPTQTTVRCSPDVPTEGKNMSCTASVSDVLTGRPVPYDTTISISYGDVSLGPDHCYLGYPADPGAGSCTVWMTPYSNSLGVVQVTASYPGNSVYLPSSGTTIVTIFQPTALVAKPAIANLVSPTKVNLKMSAALTDAFDHTPIAGETVRFIANGTTLCTGVTDASGVVTCSSLTAIALAANGYKAIFDGNATTYRLKSSASGSGVRL